MENQDKKITGAGQKPKPIQKKPLPKKSGSNLVIWILMTLGIFYILHVASMGVEKPPAELTYGNFYSILKDNPKTGRIESAVQVENVLKGKFKDGEKFIVYVPENDQEVMKLLRDNISNFDIKPIRTMWANIFYSLGPMVLFIAFLYFFIYRGAAQGGSKILAFGKSKAKQVAGGQTKITFNDVAGVDEAKEELTEIIEFLKDPKKFQRLGGKIPKGVLLMGPPGTGKTLLAKAVSGEAEVPFFSLSGSDFVEMFVGVGASRVRDLFEQAKRSAKQSQKGCIIFIDEIDAVGRQRFAGIGGGHDEREQTLNALLVEMDGFDTHAGVILIAATNRPDVLDPALLRPGRFDRQIVIDRPDLVGREQILKVHVRSIKMDKDVDLNAIARQTPGFSGADLANLANEAALLAARRDKDAVTMPELQESIERVMTGPERKSRVISKKEKSMVAYHESGHALLSLLIPGVDPLHKVSIIPRGTSALGYTMQLPLEDRYITTKTELISRLIILLGGRVSEELIFNEISTGAHNDLEVSTDIARKMVTKFGMSEKLGSLTYGKRDEQIFLGRDLFEERNYSEETARLIDQEVKSMVDYCYKIAKDKLTEHKEELKKLAEVLLEKEVLDSEEVKKIVGIKNADPKQEEPGTKKA